MIEPIGWLRTLQFVATDACVTPRCRGRGSSSSFSRKNRRVCERTSACVHLFFFLYNVLNSEYKFLWVARWCVREVPRDRFNASEKRTSLELGMRVFINFELASCHIPNYSTLYCRPVHTNHNLNSFPLRSVLVPRYIEF